MSSEIRLPQLGESIHEGTIGRWLKQPGDRIERFEPLVEIITDKVNVEMPSPLSGVLVAVLVPEGETRPVGTPIALVETAATDAATTDAATTEAVIAQAAVAPPPGLPRAPGPPQAPGSPGAPGPPQGPGGVRLSPLVRRLADEHRIPPAVLESLPGTGAGGRVTKDDLLRYVAAREAGAAGLAPAPPGPAAAPEEPDEVIRPSPIRRSTAERMARSAREIPHAYGSVEADMAAVVAWREAHKEAWAREGTPLTHTAFFVRAAAEALRAVPMVNAAWSEEGIVLRRAVNIGVAVSVDDELIVPVIRGADRMTLSGIARALDEVTRRARAGRLSIEDVQGGTFTVTNAGVFGSAWSVPLIVPGQAAILAVDAIVMRPVIRGDAIAIRPVVHLGLSFDHRVMDGAMALRFLNHVKAHLEGFRDGG